MRTDGRKRTPSTRVIAVVVMALTVVLAGCTGLGGLSSSGDDGTTAASDGDSSGSDGGATAADSSANGGPSGGDNGSGNADSASASGGGGESTSSGGSANGDGATAAEGSDSSSGSSGSSDDGASGSSGSASLNAEEDWFNLSKPGKYVFEIEDAEKGTGKMSFETTKVSGGHATTKATYDLGDDSFASTVTGPVGEVQPQLATSPAYVYLIAIQLGGFGAGALSGGEDLKVGNKFSQQSSEGSMNIEVTGTDSYAGVDCYVVETRINGTLNQKVCTQKAFSSVPYFASYDENGDLTQRVELIKYDQG